METITIISTKIIGSKAFRESIFCIENSHCLEPGKVWANFLFKVYEEEIKHNFQENRKEYLERIVQNLEELRKLKNQYSEPLEFYLPLLEKIEKNKDIELIIKESIDLMIDNEDFVKEIFNQEILTNLNWRQYLPNEPNYDQLRIVKVRDELIFGVRCFEDKRNHYGFIQAILVEIFDYLHPQDNNLDTEDKLSYLVLNYKINLILHPKTDIENSAGVREDTHVPIKELIADVQSKNQILADVLRTKSEERKFRIAYYSHQYAENSLHNIIRSGIELESITETIEKIISKLQKAIIVSDIEKLYFLLILCQSYLFLSAEKKYLNGEVFSENEEKILTRINYYKLREDLKLSNYISLIDTLEKVNIWKQILKSPSEHNILKTMEKELGKLKSISIDFVLKIYEEFIQSGEKEIVIKNPQVIDWKTRKSEVIHDELGNSFNSTLSDLISGDFSSENRIHDWVQIKFELETLVKDYITIFSPKVLLQFNHDSHPKVLIDFMEDLWKGLIDYHQQKKSFYELIDKFQKLYLEHKNYKYDAMDRTELYKQMQIIKNRLKDLKIFSGGGLLI